MFWSLLLLLVLGQILQTSIQTGSWSWLRPHRLDQLLWIFAIYVIVQTCIMIDDGPTRLSSLGEIKWVLLFYALIFAFSRIQNGRRTFMIWGGAYAIVALYALWQSRSGLDLIRGSRNPLEPFGSFYRAEGFFDLPLTLAYNVGLVSFVIGGFAWVQWQLGRKSPAKWFALFSALTLLTVLVTGVRGAWLAMAIAISVFVFFAWRRYFWRFVGGGLAVVVAMLAVASSFRERFLSSFSLENASNFGRIKIWSGYLEIFKDYPIFGAGMHRTSQILPDYYEKLGIIDGQVSHAHNNFLHFLAGTGVIGEIFFLATSAAFLVLAFKSYRGYQAKNSPLSVLALSLFSAQIYFHLGGLTESNFLDSEVQFVMVTVWALTAVLFKNLSHGHVEKGLLA